MLLIVWERSSHALEAVRPWQHLGRFPINLVVLGPLCLVTK